MITKIIHGSWLAENNLAKRCMIWPWCNTETDQSANGFLFLHGDVLLLSLFIHVLKTTGGPSLSTQGDVVKLSPNDYKIPLICRRLWGKCVSLVTDYCALSCPLIMWRNNSFVLDVVPSKRRDPEYMMNFTTKIRYIKNDYETPLSTVQIMHENSTKISQ